MGLCSLPVSCLAWGDSVQESIDCLVVRMLTASVGRPEVPKGQEEIKLQMANFFFFFPFSFNPVLLWRHLAPPGLNYLRPWANQCIFLMEVSFLSYVNELCICLEICLSSRFLSIVLWPWMTHLVPMLSQSACCGWGAWCNSQFWGISFL